MLVTVVAMCGDVQLACDLLRQPSRLFHRGRSLRVLRRAMTPLPQLARLRTRGVTVMKSIPIAGSASASPHIIPSVVFLGRDTSIREVSDARCYCSLVCRYPVLAEP